MIRRKKNVARFFLLVRKSEQKIVFLARGTRERMCDFDGGYGETADSQISPAGSPPPGRPSLLVDAFQSVPDSPLQEPKDSHLAFLIDMYGGSVPQAVISSAFEISHSNFARAEEVIRRFMETDARNNNGLRTPS